MVNNKIIGKNFFIKPPHRNYDGFYEKIYAGLYPIISQNLEV